MLVVVLDTKDQILPCVLLLTRCSNCRGEAHVSISGHRELTFTLEMYWPGKDGTTESWHGYTGHMGAAEVFSLAV